MNYGFIKTAAITPEIKVADCDFNADRIISWMAKANEIKAKLAVFPELCVTGYTCGDLFFQTRLQKAAEKALDKIRKSTDGIEMAVIIGCPLMVKGKLYNCGVAICNGHYLGAVPKQYLPNYNEFYEKRQFTEAKDFNDTEITLGDENVSVSVNMIFRCRQMHGFTFGIELCEDLWTISPPSEKLASMGAVIIANLSASNETIGKENYRHNLVTSQSGRIIGGYVYCSAGDGESTTDMVFSGHNIIAENGSVIAESTLFENEMTVSEIDTEKLLNERIKNTSFPSSDGGKIIEFSITPEKTQLTRVIPKTPFVPYSSADRHKRCETILLMQSNGLKKRLVHTNAKTVVLGISGGLDSCLALLVCVKAMDLLKRPHSDIIAVTMPCFGTTKRTKSNAEKLCDALGVTFRDIDITKSVIQHFNDISHDINNHNVVYENGQARERTKVIMDIANMENGLVIGTGDLSELALGWATYNGDHMSMYGVNASVPKTLVRHIVRYYGDETSDLKLRDALYDILDTPVSPELLPADDDGNISQVTEDIVGPYELHDFFLYYAVRWGFEPNKVKMLAEYAFKDEYDNTVILKWLKTFYRRFFSQQFKRSCLPDSPKIGSVTLSPRADWRMPSDANASEWLKTLDD